MQKFWAINSLNASTAEILLYGYIGGDAVSAASFIAELKTLEKTHSNIKLRVNSGGGSIFEGLAIFNAIKNSPCNIEAYVDGLAASMATIIVLACKKVHMSKVAMLMLHRAKGTGAGTSEDLRRHADMLDELEVTMGNLYAEKTGCTITEAKAKYMNGADNWFTASEALAEGLVDSIYDAPVGATPPTTTASFHEEDIVNHFTNYLNQDNTMKTVTLAAAEMAALNLDASASQEATVAAIAALAEKAAKVEALENSLATANASLEAMKTAAATAKVTALVDGAVAAKKIAEGEKDTYKKLATADYVTTEALLNTMKPYASVEGQMHDTTSATAVELAALAAKTGRELYMEGKLERLKELSVPVFEAKYKEYFGAAPKK